MTTRAEEQRRLIVDQLTRQAVPFAQMPAHSNDEANRLLVELAGITAADSILVVACGPGLVACALAEVARHVTGIDLTLAMIEQARARQRERGLSNVTWLVGDAVPLPFPDAPPADQPGRQPPAAQERVGGVLLVDQPHQPQVLCRLGHPPVVQAGAAVRRSRS